MQTKEKIIGIDPGYGRLGVAILEKKDNVFSVVYSDCIETDKGMGFEDRLFFICQEMKKIIVKHKPQYLSMESLFVNKNQKTISGVYQVRGAVLYIAKELGLSVIEVSPQQVKIAITGYGKSEKSAVEKMIRTVLALPKDKKYIDDEIDALAVAYSGFFY